MKVDALVKRTTTEKKISTTKQNKRTNMTERLILMLAVIISICQDAGKVVLWLVLSTHFRDLTLFLFKSK